MKNAPKKVRLLAAIVTLGIVLFVGGRLYVFWRLEKTIAGQLESIQTAGIYVHYKSLDVNAWKGSLRITELEIRFPSPDSICSSNASIPELYVEGISLIPLIFEKELSLKSVFINYPSLHYASNFKMAGRTKGKKGFLKNLKIGQVHIESGTLEIIDSITCACKLNSNLDFVLNGLTIHKPGLDSITWSVSDAKATAISIALPSHFYKVTVKEVVYNGQDKFLKLDSLYLAPTSGRLEFAKKMGNQIDQFTFMLPTLEVNGFEMGPPYQPSFSARQVSMNFHLIVFRDKRFPRARRKPAILPVRFLRQLPYRLQIDSVRITPSFISYEEFPEKGDETGRIFFNNLQAGIYNVSNDSVQDARMNVTTRFMNAGNLSASFMFPLKAKKSYTVNGSLTKFSLPEINGILVQVGNMKIESGTMNEMKFQFSYNDYMSEGELEVSYTGLKVLSLRKDLKNETNKFLSFLMRVLFIKKDLDKTMGKATGQIQWERDTQKGILNYWWKSVLSGIKAVYDLDKPMGNKEKEKSK